MLSLDGVAEFLSCLLELLLGRRSRNGVWLALCIRELSSVDASLVLDLDVNWPCLALNGLCTSIHGVVHYSSLIVALSISQAHLLVISWAVAINRLTLGVAVSVWLRDNAATNDSKGT